MGEYKYTLSMVFLAQSGDKTTISLSDVREDINEVEISEVMDILLANDIFECKYGNLVSKVDAKLISRAVTEYEF